MSVNAGKGQAFETNQVHYLTKKITFADDDDVVSVGWLPANSAVIGSGIHNTVAWTAGTIAIDVGFRNSVEGHTDDPNAFTETAFTGAIGYLAGDVVSAANLVFSAPAEVTCSPTSSGTLTAGSSFVHVSYVVLDNSEPL